MHAIEEINVLSGKMDELMKLFANESASSDPNDMPLSTLIENNNESLDVHFVGRNNFGKNVYRGNFNSRPFPSNCSNNYSNSYNNSYGNFNNMPSDFEISVKEFMSSQKNFNAFIEENFSRLMIWLGTLIDFRLMLILLKLDLLLLSMISMSLSKQ